MKKFRKDYLKHKLDVQRVSKNPYLQFAKWFREADLAGISEPNAFSLSTADSKGRPSSRVLLLKNYSKDGFIFFTNYNSRKGHELSANPYAAILFYWPELERQIRIEGRIKKIPVADSDKYFKSRPPEARAGAAVSRQSSIIKDKNILINAAVDLLKTGNIKRPADWGGYILKAVYFEFWQGGSARLHDRIAFQKSSAGWKICRLSP